MKTSAATPRLLPALCALLLVLSTVPSVWAVDGDGAKAPPRAIPVDPNETIPGLPVPYLDLNRCYELALLRMETVGMSAEDVRAAQARYWQAVGTALPSVKMVGEQGVYSDRAASFGVNSNVTSIPGTQPDIDDYPQTARVNVHVPIFAGLQDIELAKAAKAEIGQSREQARQTRQNLYLDVAESFYQVLNYEGDLLVLHDIERSLEERVADLEKRVKLGKSRESESIQARNALAQARVTIEQTNGLLGAARELLLFYTGLKESSQLVLQDTSAPPPGSLELAEYLDKTAQRPDVLAAVQAERSSRAQLSAAKGAHWPTISFDGNYYLYDSDSVQDGSFNGFLTVEVPIFEGGSIEAKVNENKALFARSRLDLSRLQREAVRDVRTAYNNFNSSLAELARLDEALKTAVMNYEAQKADYNLGVVNSLDVLDSLRSLLDTRRSYIAARIDARVYLIKLYVAAGTVNDNPGVKK